MENCMKFLDEVAANSKVQTMGDWKKVTLTSIVNKGGKVSTEFLFMCREYYYDMEVL